MKNSAHLIVMILAIGFLALTSSTALACEGDGGGDKIQAETQGTGIKSNGSSSSASSGVVFNPANIKIKRKWETINKINKNRHLLGYFERVESIGNISTATAQYGILAFSYKYVNKVLFFPFAVFWNVPKHSSRIAYGLYTGKLNTVYSVNKKSLSGQIVNYVIIQHIK